MKVTTGATRAVVRLVAFGIVACLFLASAEAEKRVGLVIGNNEYPSLSADEQLRKAINDANAVGDSLAKVGFEVARGTNLSRAELLTALLSMAAKLEPGDLAFFFYAGHGVSIDGANYLLPSDIPPAAGGGEDLIKLSAVSESTIVATLKARGVRVAIVVLDACRNNPFSPDGTRSFGDGTRGLARAPAVDTKGVFGLYSAGFGEAALDRLGDDDENPNSVFTRVLAPALATPGLSLLDIAYTVNEEVERLARTVGEEQNPAYYDQARARNVYIAGKPESAMTNGALPSPECTLAEAHYNAAVQIGTKEAFEDHLSRFGECPFATLARQQLASLSTEPGSVTTPIARLPDAPTVSAGAPAIDVVVPLAEWDPSAPASASADPGDIVVPIPPGSTELFGTPPNF